MSVWKTGAMNLPAATGFEGKVLDTNWNFATMKSGNKYLVNTLKFILHILSRNTLPRLVLVSCKISEHLTIYYKPLLKY